MTYYTAKIFNVQQQPKDIQTFLFYCFKECNNNTFYHWDVGWIDNENIDEYYDKTVKNNQAIDKYFREQGIKNHETVVIHMWW
jgi:hypothetical protein